MNNVPVHFMWQDDVGGVGFGGSLARREEGIGKRSPRRRTVFQTVLQARKAHTIFQAMSLFSYQVFSNSWKWLEGLS